jgi:3-dehydroquinate synthase
MKSVKLNFSKANTFIFYDLDLSYLLDLISSYSNDYNTLIDFKSSENLSFKSFNLNKFKIFQNLLKFCQMHLSNTYSRSLNECNYQKNINKKNYKKQKMQRYNSPDILILVDFHIVDKLIFNDTKKLGSHPEYKNINGLKRIDETLINCIVNISDYVNTKGGQSIYIVPLICSENEKNLKSVEMLYELFSYLSLSKDSLVVSVGGGVMSDICGFASSTYLRGINFAIVPTTLLSMIDASVGGKNGVNFKNHKNIIGNFYFPRFIAITPQLISFLDNIELISGFAEYLKYIYISNNQKKILNTINSFESYKKKIENTSERNKDNLSKICSFIDIYFNDHSNCILNAIMFKYKVVKTDEKDCCKRHILNFGHTIGHALEKSLSLPHGLSVLIGMLWEIRISYLSGLTDLNYYLNFLSTLKSFNLPFYLTDLLRISKTSQSDIKKLIMDKKNDILFSIKHDKKIEQNSLVLYLPEKSKFRHHHRFTKVRIDVMRFIDYLDDFLLVEINE